MGKRLITKCSGCNDYGLKWKFMTYKRASGRFCNCEFGIMRKKQYELEKKLKKIMIKGN